MTQSQLRLWLDDELAHWKGTIGYVEIFVICWRLIGKLEKEKSL